MDRIWFHNLDMFFIIVSYVSLATGTVCAILLLFLDASHFAEYKLLAIQSVTQVAILLCRIEPGYHSYNRRVTVTLLQKGRLCLVLFIFKEVWLNEDRIQPQTVFKKVLTLTMAAICSGIILFVLLDPLSWLALDFFSGLTKLKNEIQCF